MNKGLLGGLVVLGLGIVFLITVAMLGVGFYNSWTTAENTLQTKYEDNQQNYDAFFKKVQETAQVPTEYTSQLKELYGQAMSARYENDQNLLFKMVKEQNPNISDKMYVQLQRVIESGRNDFKNSQTQILDMRNTYKNSLDVLPNALFAKFLGFPKVNLSKYDALTSGETQEAFATKKADTLDVFQKNKK